MSQTELSVPTSDDDLHDDEALRNPYPLWRELRDTAGAVWLNRYDMFAISRYADVRAALMDWETYSSAKGTAMNERKNEALKGTTLNTDPPVHREMRRVLHRPLQAKELRALQGEFEAEAERLIDALLERERFDAVADLAQHLPVSIVSKYVGLPEEGRERMLIWAAASFNASGPIDKEMTCEAFPVLGEQASYIDEYAVPGKLKPDGWGQKLYDAAEQGDIPHEKCKVMMYDYINPSLDTTINAISSALWLFGQHPEQWALLRERPELIPNAINEVVRIESPIPSFTRTTTVDTTIDGVEVPQGSRVMLLYGSANRDERQWTDPEVFDIEREGVARQLGWGVGEHACVGMGLARLEMRSILQALTAKVTTIELGTMERASNMTLRGLKRLDVRVA